MRDTADVCCHAEDNNDGLVCVGGGKNQLSGLPTWSIGPLEQDVSERQHFKARAMALMHLLTKFNAKLPTMVFMSAAAPATSATATRAKTEREPICSIRNAISQRGMNVY